MSDWPEVIELKGYTPKPGDVLFITVRGQITEQTAQRLSHTLEEMMPGVKAVVLSDGVTVEVPTT